MSNHDPQTLFEKIWNSHLVSQEPGAPALLYIDLQLVHEVTSPQAFQELRDRGLAVRRPLQTVATVDHSIPTTDPSLPWRDAQAAAQVARLESNCQEFAIPVYGTSHPERGIVHVIGPELGLTQPGMTIVCGDSHTSTHGAFGSLAFGIGTSEIVHVLATQTLLQNRPRTMEVQVEGELATGVTAKDIILALIAKIGIGGGTGCVIEYTGSAIRAMGMEGRMTICNMSIEAGARAGMIAPDEVTFAYLAGRRFAPAGAEWEARVAEWRRLATDPGARYDVTVQLDAAALKPMVTFGTNPAMGLPIDGHLPDPADLAGQQERDTLAKAMRYMDLTPGQPILGQKIDVVFIGSCTNGRLGDLRDAARLLKGRAVAQGVRVLVVPGSQSVKRLAEAEGLDQIFREAGAEWRESGCSMCLAMNGDQVEAGQYAISTSNRNFEGRQGKGARTLLASPLTAAASAISGCVTDPRPFLN